MSHRMGCPNHKIIFAVSWLKSFIQDEQAHRAVTVKLEAAKKGISHRTLVRAGNLAGFHFFKSGCFWYWGLTANAIPDLFSPEESI